MILAFILMFIDTVTGLLALLINNSIIRRVNCTIDKY